MNLPEPPDGLAIEDRTVLERYLEPVVMRPAGRCFQLTCPRLPLPDA